MTEAELFQHIGVLLHGRNWQQPLARELDRNVRTVRRYALLPNETPQHIPRPVWERLYALLAARRNALDDAGAQVERRLAKPDRQGRNAA
jgi:hypothetical protein